MTTKAFLRDTTLEKAKADAQADSRRGDKKDKKKKHYEAVPQKKKLDARINILPPTFQYEFNNDQWYSLENTYTVSMDSPASRYMHNFGSAENPSPGSATGGFVAARDSKVGFLQESSAANGLAYDTSRDLFVVIEPNRKRLPQIKVEDESALVDSDGAPRMDGLHEKIAKLVAGDVNYTSHRARLTSKVAQSGIQKIVAKAKEALAVSPSTTRKNSVGKMEAGEYEFEYVYNGEPVQGQERQDAGTQPKVLPVVRAREEHFSRGADVSMLYDDRFVNLKKLHSGEQRYLCNSCLPAGLSYTIRPPNPDHPQYTENTFHYTVIPMPRDSNVTARVNVRNEADTSVKHNGVKEPMYIAKKGQIAIGSKIRQVLRASEYEESHGLTRDMYVCDNYEVIPLMYKEAVEESLAIRYAPYYMIGTRRYNNRTIEEEWDFILGARMSYSAVETAGYQRPQKYAMPEIISPNRLKMTKALQHKQFHDMLQQEQAHQRDSFRALRRDNRRIEIVSAAEQAHPEGAPRVDSEKLGNWVQDLSAPSDTPDALLFDDPPPLNSDELADIEEEEAWAPMASKNKRRNVKTLPRDLRESRAYSTAFDFTSSNDVEIPGTLAEDDEASEAKQGASAGRGFGHEQRVGGSRAQGCIGRRSQACGHEQPCVEWS